MNEDRPENGQLESNSAEKSKPQTWTRRNFLWTGLLGGLGLAGISKFSPYVSAEAPPPPTPEVKKPPQESAEAPPPPTPEVKKPPQEGFVLYQDRFPLVLPTLMTPTAKPLGNSEVRPLDEPPLIDPTAPTFVSQCSSIAHVYNRPEAKVTNNRLILKLICFTDQADGIADVDSGMFQNPFVQKAQVIQDFYNHFMGINFTSDPVVEKIIAANNYDYYLPSEGGALIAEMLPKFTSYSYDGHTYPIICMVEVPNESNPRRLGSSAGWTGQATQPLRGYILVGREEILWSTFTSKAVMAHETGHTLGMPHNSNLKSMMYPYSNSESKFLDANDVQLVCNAVPQRFELFIPLVNKNAP